jgi:hypothetical protein
MLWKIKTIQPKRFRVLSREQTLNILKILINGIISNNREILITLIIIKITTLIITNLLTTLINLKSISTNLR